MRKDLTEVVFILDKSGSMRGLEADTIGGFNSMLERQKKAEGEAYISTILFDSHQTVLHDRVPVGKVEPITEKEYYVGSTTALLDAMGDAIQHIATVHKYAREEDRPEKTIVIVTTDGYENASRRYTYEDIKARVTEMKQKYDWEFLFLGANVDAFDVASRFGISKDYASGYVHDADGTALNYEAMADAISCVRERRPLSSAWKQKV
ncbi:MAG: VWA domain-containing protein, partial [Lachnospiraceae bacterium]|nr:VWA domain-containing protein [Lachnospiraceae bacterium]